MLASLTASYFAAQATWTLAVGGDIMLNGVRAGVDPFEEIGSAFRDADVAVANLEIPLTTNRTTTRRKSAAELKARTQYILKGSPEHVDHLADAGFDLVSLGNNHAMDYGWKGVTEMTDRLAARSILWTGAGANMADAEKVAVVELPSGFKVGLIGALAFLGSSALNKCTPAGVDSPGIAVFRFEGILSKRAKEELKRRITDAKSQCDFLIVAPHWGVERQTKPSAWQVKLGRAMIDAGADMVAGAHPHVLQGRELYKGKPILYSCGNLISSMPAKSAVYSFTFEDGQLKNWDLRPYRISGGKGAWYAARDEAGVKAAILRVDRPGDTAPRDADPDRPA